MRRSDGYLLVPVLLLLGVLASVSYLIGVEGSIGSRLLRAEARGDAADYLTHAALSHARWIAQGPTCGGDASLDGRSLGDHRYAARIEAASGANRLRRLPADRDTWVDERAPDSGHGRDAALELSNAIGARAQALYHFDVSALDDGTRVAAARLWLGVEAGDSDAPIAIHALTRPWDERDASWSNTRDGIDASVLALLPRQTGSGRVAVDLTGSVQAWRNDARRNHGVILIASSDGARSRLASREASEATRPYLEVVTSSGGDPSPLQLIASAQLASGEQRSATRRDVRAFQQPARTVYAPGAGVEDAYVEQGRRSARNFGGAATLAVDARDQRSALLRFELAALPRPVHVFDARLVLHLERATSLRDGVLSLHRVTRSWVEGSENGGVPARGEGVTFLSHDGASAWDSPGGDYDPAPIAELALPGPTPGFHAWDVTRQLQRWLDGRQPNHGLLLRASAGEVAGLEWTSGDATLLTRRPQLELSLGCECGRVCTLPRGAGAVLMLVGQAAAPGPADRLRHRLLESFGFEVTLLDDGAAPAALSNALASNDVAFVSGSADPTRLGAALGRTPKGVVSELGALVDELGLATSSVATTGRSLRHVSNHYVTELFPPGSLALYRAAMRGTAAAGTLAPDLAVLLGWARGPGLAILDAGQRTVSGGRAPGRRVQLPHGPAGTLDWDHAELAAGLILQRALQWAANGPLPATPPRVCDGSFADGFPEIAYDGDEGTLSWSGEWQELGERDGPGRGRVRVARDNGSLRGLASHQLELRDDARGLVRALDLGGAGRAELGLLYRRKNLDDAEDYVAIELSRDGTGGPFHEIARLAGPGTDLDYRSLRVDVSAYAARGAALRLITSPTLGSGDRVWLDAVQLRCAPR